MKASGRVCPEMSDITVHSVQEVVSPLKFELDA
jgi:hypothetical protein